jgi:beta-galactosidase
LQEVRFLYQYLVPRISADGASVEVVNRYLFTRSSAFECVVTIHREGELIASAGLDTYVAPGTSATYPLPVTVPPAEAERAEYVIQVSFRLRKDTAWAKAGHEVGFGQRVVVRPGFNAGARATARFDVVDGTHNIGVRGEHFEALFSRKFGCLSSYRWGFTTDGGRELLRGLPQPLFWHAPTSNESGWGMPFRDGQWMLASKYQKVLGEPEVAVVEEGVRVVFNYALPTVPASSVSVAYLVSGDGCVQVTETMTPPAELLDAPEFGFMLPVSPELDRLRWYGDGPEECYVDRRNGARLGVWNAAVADQLTPYLRPQEAGNHTGVRWAEITDRSGWGLRVSAPVDSPMEFSAMPWTPFEIENARHHHDLPPVERTILRPALMRRGVGGDQSWGAMTHPEYRLPVGQKLEFTFTLQGIWNQ